MVELLQQGIKGIDQLPDPLGPYLALTGGGSHGAWGAGVLYGGHLTGAVPEFDVITGVSTGAVMATLALIGDYAALKNLYANVQESDVQRSPWPWDDGFRRALYTRKPLRKLMDCVLHNKLADGTSRFEHVKQARKANRKLVVGTVDMDTGEFCAWDMTCIACNDDDELYLDVAMASANAPLVGPPVDLEVQTESGETVRHPHVDGGARAQIFAQKVASANITEGRDVYFLVNGKLKGGVRQMKPGWDGGMMPIVQNADRGLELLEHEALELVLHYYKAQITGKEKKLYLSRTPENVDLEFRSRQFPRDDMAKLFKAGCQWGNNMSTWPEWNTWDPPPGSPPRVWPDPPPDCIPPVKRPPGPLCTPDEG